MNKNIKKILELLEKNGYQAYLVGGFVRDMLIGIKSNDVDICTNALPKDLYAIFNVSANKYGGVNLNVGKYNVDITTFRIDKNYINRHPNEVIYTNNLSDDILRRDFTINAICMDKNMQIIDLLDGTTDLNNRVIKMIGNVDEKLSEDPLRILRAIRFKTILDFEIDPMLLAGIKKNYKLVSNLSKTRVREEFDKILMSKNALNGLNLMRDIGILDLLNIKYNEINYVDDLLGMWAQIKVSDMPFTNNEKRSIIKITEIVNNGVIDNNTLFDYGLYICTVAGLILNISPKTISKMYKDLVIKDLKDIDITVPEMLDLGVSKGKEISKVYQSLKKQILSGKINNEKREIVDYILKRK